MSDDRPRHRAIPVAPADPWTRKLCWRSHRRWPRPLNL